MTITELLADLQHQGVKFEVRGSQLAFAPQSAVSVSQRQLLIEHKAAAMAIINGLTPPLAVDGPSTVDTEEIPPALLQPFEELDDDGWPLGSIDPDELTPCVKCGRLELWLSAAGDLFGMTDGVWRCLRCDPPARARKLLARTRWLRNRRY